MEAEKKSRNLIFATTTSILVALLGVLGWQFVEQKNAAEKAQFELAELTLSDSLVYEFNVLKYEFKTVTSQNKELKGEVSQQTQQIASLISEIDALQNSSNDSKLKEAYSKLQNLKKINHQYVNRIDAINREKEVLLAENNALREDLNSEKNYSKTLEEKLGSTNLPAKIEIKESELAVKNFEATPIDYNFEGKEVIAKKASKTEKILVCFTTEKDMLVKKGRKTAFINIYSPSGTLITRTADGFNYKGGSKNYTLKTTFNYQNKEADVCSYWFSTKKYLPGNYKTELIIDSQVITSSSFNLK